MSDLRKQDRVQCNREKVAARVDEWKPGVGRFLELRP